jgi:hypothetical protein
MADNKFSSDDIQKIPNSVSGDGRTFVAQLKKALLSFAGNVSSGVSEAIKNTSTAFGQAANVTLLEQHTTDDLGFPENDVYVTWEKGNVTGYNGASVWYKAGETGQYKYAGNANGATYTVKKLTAGTTYTIKVVAINKFGISCDFNAAPTADITVQGSSHLPTAPDQFTVTWEGGTPHWQWTAVNTQDYFDGYELRENTDAGKYKGMLDSTSALTSDAVPSERSGTAYLFARSVFGTYGSPRTHQYELAQPTAPTAPTIESLFQGFNVHMASLPANCTGIEILATNTSTNDEHSFYTENSVFQIGILEGNYDFKYRYYDCFGNGEWSEGVNADVTKVVGSDWIQDGAVKAEKIATNAVNADKILAGAITTEKIAANAVTAGKIGASAVLAENIAAGAVTAGKIKVDSLSAISANVGSLKGGTITGTQIVGTDFRNSSGSFTVDDNGNITGATLKSGSIDTSKVTLSGYEVHAVNFIRGKISDGETVPLPSGYTEDQCMWGVSCVDDKHWGSCDGRTAKFYYMKYVNETSWVDNTPITWTETYVMRGGSGIYWCLGVR